MGWRFRKSIKIVPGVRVNFGKKGASVSVGGKGATVNISSKGTRYTVGIPGTGVSYSEFVKKKPHNNSTKPAHSKIESNGISGKTILFIVAIIGLIAQQPFIYVIFGCLWILSFFIVEKQNGELIDQVEPNLLIESKCSDIKTLSEKKSIFYVEEYQVKPQFLSLDTQAISNVGETASIEIGSERFNDVVVIMKYEQDGNHIFMCVMSYKNYNKAPCGGYLSEKDIEDIIYKLTSTQTPESASNSKFENNYTRIEFHKVKINTSVISIKIRDPNDKRKSGFSLEITQADLDRFIQLFVSAINYLKRV